MIEPWERIAIADALDLLPADVICREDVSSAMSLLVRKVGSIAVVSGHDSGRAALRAAERISTEHPPTGWPVALYDRTTDTLHRLALSLTAMTIHPLTITTGEPHE